MIAGARSGKDSRIAAPLVCYEAAFGGHEKQLHRGERAIIPVVAQDLRATKIAFGYIRDYITGSAALRSLVAEVRALEVELTNGITIACFPSTQRSLRGWSIPVGVMDELGFYRLEGSADSDVEIQASIRRGMLAFERTRLLKISTPYIQYVAGGFRRKEKYYRATLPSGRESARERPRAHLLAVALERAARCEDLLGEVFGV